MNAAAARNAYIQNHTLEFVYESPLETVWPNARTLLFEEGFSVNDTGEGSTTLETDWLYTQYEHRFLVQGIAVDESTCQVLFTEQSRNSSGAVSSGRAWDLEWELIQRVEPDRARQIEIGAQAAADASRAQ